MIGDEFIGRGWRFPIRVNQRGGLDWSEGPDRVRDAIWLVLNTGVGERVMRPTFGAGVQDYVFKPRQRVLRSRRRSARHWSDGSRASRSKACASMRRLAARR